MAQGIGSDLAALQDIDSPMILPLLDMGVFASVLSDLRPTRLLGFVAARSANAVQSALATAAGPAVTIQRGPDIALLMQAEPKKTPPRRGRKTKREGLEAVQKRLEIACQVGPFLPVDPVTACCPTGIIPRLLDASWSALADALAQHGCRHEWDVILRWNAESVVSRRCPAIAERSAAGGKFATSEAMTNLLQEERAERETALLAVLTPTVLALGQVIGSATEVTVTVLLPAGGAAVVEAAVRYLLSHLPDDFSFEMRGPLPPLSFAAVRVAKLRQGEVTRAWRRLDLPERIDASSLHWHWRLRAASAHSDRKLPTEPAASSDAISEITSAYRLLRDLLPSGEATGEGQTSLAELLQRAGHRLIIPTAELPTLQPHTLPSETKLVPINELTNLEQVF